MASVQIVEPAPADPFNSPEQTVNSLQRFDPNISFGHRAHIRGQVTMLWPVRSVCVQDATQGICAETVQTTPVGTGEVVDVVGFPAAGDFTPTLTDAEFHRAGERRAEKARLIEAEQALRGDHDSRLVQIAGRLIGTDQAAPDPTLLLSAGKFVFPAILPSEASNGTLPNFKEGSMLRFTGICSVSADRRRTDEGEVVSRPSWWTVSTRCKCWPPCSS